jgi:hypothetical protein
MPALAFVASAPAVPISILGAVVDAVAALWH